MSVDTFPQGGGEMGRAIAGLDWASTELGPVDAWPASLKAAVNLMVNSRFAMCMAWGPELTLLYNDGYIPMLGARHGEALGRPIAKVWWDVWDDIRPLVEDAMSGRATWNVDTHLVMQRNGYAEDTWWTFSYSPLHDDAGTIAGFLDVCSETTGAVRSSMARDEVHREMVHRIKNTISVTSAVVTASMRHARSLDEARDTIARRIEALSRTQTLLTRPEGDTDVDGVVREAIAPHLDGAGRVRLDGPSVQVSAQQAVGLSLAIYELATNAAKYGALSAPAGTVDIVWRSGADSAFEFHWRESGGPEVQAPSRSGFGSRLTNRIVAAYFSGTGETEYAPDGVKFTLKGRTRVEADDAAPGT